MCVEYIVFESSLEGGIHRMKDYLVGIDVSSSKVCFALGKRLEDGNFQLIEVASVKYNVLSKTLVEDIDAATEAIKLCVEKLQAKSETSLKNIILNFPGGLCDLFHTKGAINLEEKNKKVNNNDIAKLLDETKLGFTESRKEIIGIIPKKYIVDNVSTDQKPVGEICSRLEVEADIITTEIRPIYDLLLSLERAGIVPDEIVIQPVSLATLLKKEELNKGSFLIDIGADTSDLCIYKNKNICYTKTVPLGGNNITSDISKCLGISFEDAESIKVSYGDMDYRFKEEQYKNEYISLNSEDENMKSVDKFTLNQIIFARVEEILKFILDELKTSSYYGSIETIVVSGGGISLFNGIHRLMEDMFGKRVRIISQDIDKETNTSNTTAISIIKNKIDSYNLEASIVEAEGLDKEPSKTKSKKFGWRIAEFLEGFF
jgi:cell division protein FtsA